jgi:hypothetical protein
LAAVEENGTKKAKLEPYDLPKLDAGGDIENQARSNSASDSEIDTDQILTYWRSNPDVLRKSIAKAIDEIRRGHLGIQDFKVVSATESQSDKQQMEILTFFKLDYAAVGQHSRGGSVEAGFDYYTTVVVDRRDNSVVEVGPATTERPQ